MVSDDHDRLILRELAKEVAEIAARPEISSRRRMWVEHIFSWKPNSAHLVGNFDSDAIKKYIRHTVEAAKANGCVLEMILKDTHTVEHHP